MKLIVTLVSSLFAVSAFAAEPAKKEVKAEAKPAVVAPAASTPVTAKADIKSEPAKKAETPKK